jgi:ribosomal protein S12 methylthiotransferase accessory factor
MSSQNERSYSLNEALAAAERELARLNVEVDVAVLEDEPYCVLFGEVRAPVGDVVCVASGKGRGTQGRASLLFEAIEHLQLSRCAHEDITHRDVRLLTMREVCAQPALANESHLRRMAGEFADVKAACLPFRSLLHDGEIFYPATMKNPSFAKASFSGDENQIYDSYLRYATNSGTASGMSPADATLHGLLEVIERDAVSLALIDWFVVDRPAAPKRRVSIDSLSPALRDLARHVERRLGQPPMLFDITTDLGVPVFMALPAADIGLLGLYGAGASLHPEYAAERALGELLQGTLIAKQRGVEDVRRRRFQVISGWPRLQACFALDPESVAAGAVESVSLRAPMEASRGSVDEQLLALARRLEEHGVPTFARPWTDDEATPVVCVVAPGLENFFVVLGGVPALPTGRGMAKIAEGLS